MLSLLTFEGTAGRYLQDIEARWVLLGSYRLVTDGLGHLVENAYASNNVWDFAAANGIFEHVFVFNAGTQPGYYVGIAGNGSSNKRSYYFVTADGGNWVLMTSYTTLATIADSWTTPGDIRRVRLEFHDGDVTMTVRDGTGDLIGTQTVTGKASLGNYGFLGGVATPTNPQRVLISELGVYDYASSTQIVDLQSSWRVLTDQDLSAAWSVLRMEEAVAAWRVLARTDAAAAWRVLAATEIQSAWRVVSAAALEAAWRVMRSEDLSAAWAVLARQGVSLSAAWRVLAESGQLASWMVKTAAGADAGWRVLTTSDRQVAWAVKKAVDQDASWRVLTKAEIDAAWAVLSDLVVMPPASRTVFMAAESRTVAISYESRTIIMLEE